MRNAKGGNPCPVHRLLSLKKQVSADSGPMPVIIEKEDWVFWLGEDLSNFICPAAEKRAGLADREVSRPGQNDEASRSSPQHRPSRCSSC
jgi:hypothetical protein